MSYSYYEFYFGSASYPTETLWRINQETGELGFLVYAGVGQTSLKDVRDLWEYVQAIDMNVSEPHYTQWSAEGVTYYGLRYWYTYPDQVEAHEHFTRDGEFSLDSEADRESYSEGMPL